MRQRQNVGKRGEAGENSRREVARDYEDLSGYAIQTHPVWKKDGFMFLLDRERSSDQERALSYHPLGVHTKPSGVDTLSSPESRRAG